jgi:DNA modification methylase
MRKGRFLGQDIMRGEWDGNPRPDPRPEATPLGGLSTRKDFDVSPTHNSTSPSPQTIHQNETENTNGGTSIFDPCLCELAYRWFCPAGGQILDPFAGGSVRGIVASRLRLLYSGIDLRSEQIEANRAQAARICAGDWAPNWRCGDSRELLDDYAAGSQDLVFTCPPYGDLEIYSDDPSDISGFAPADFDEAMRLIILKAARALKPDRFSIWVASDYRLADGGYAQFPSKIRRWHSDAGLRLYNEAILINAVGSLPIRAGKQFEATRKLGRTHQEILIFLKGDERRATAAMAPIDAKAIDDALRSA